MAPAEGHLIDTNILLRLTQHHDPQHGLVKAAVDELDRRGSDLYFSIQNIAEFWNVCTRTVEGNGYGLSATEAELRVKSIERTMTLLPDSDRVYSIWRRLIVARNVRGVQVHDARLAAIMEAYGVTHILTLNQPDFSRYSNLQAIHPSKLLS